MSDSKLFKRSRVILNDKSYVVSIPKRMLNVNLTDIPEQSVTIPVAPTGEPEVILDAEQEAARIIKEAKESSEAIIVDAYHQADRIRENAEKEGKDLGYKEGFSLGTKEAEQTLNDEYNKKIDEVLSIKNELNEKHKNLFKDSEAEIIDLVLTTVDKVFETRRHSDEYLIETLIKQAVSKISKSTTITIRVSDIDYPIAIASRNRILTGSERIDDIEFKRDSSLEQGSCLIESENGIIDSSLDSQFQGIREIFTALLNKDK